MNDTDRKEESWIRKIPTIIAVLAALIFIFIVISEHNTYKQWKKNQSELSGKVKQVSEELELLRNANGSLQNVLNKVETLEQQASETAAALDTLIKEKSSTDITLSRLRDELTDLNDQVAAGRSKVAELEKEAAAMSNTNQRLRDDIISKKNVLDSTAFMQRQKTILEQNISDLETRNDLAAKKGTEEQARLEALQNKITEAEASLQSLNEQRSALNSELAELTENVEKLASKEENLALLEDHDKKLEYLEYLQLQKEALEITINSLLEKAQKLEESKTPPQQ